MTSPASPRRELEQRPQLAQLVAELEHQWTSRRRIEPGLVEEALGLSAGEQPDERAEVLCWLVLDALEWEDLPRAVEHGEELVQLAAQLRPSALRKLAYLRSARVAWLLGDEREALLMSFWPQLVEPGPRSRELLIEREIQVLRLSELAGELVPALASSRCLARQLPEPTPGWLRSELLADLVCRELRAGDPARVSELVEAHATGPESVHLFPAPAAAEIASFSEFVLGEIRRDDSALGSGVVGWGRVLGFVDALRAGLDGSRLRAALEEIHRVLDAGPETPDSRRVAAVLGRLTARGRLGTLERSRLQRHLIRRGPYRFLARTQTPGSPRLGWSLTLLQRVGAVS